MEAIIISGSWILVVILIVALLDLNKRVHELEEKVKAIVEPCKNLLVMWQEVTEKNICPNCQSFHPKEQPCLEERKY